MADLRSARVKIDRAKKHLADLDAAIKAFDALHPYSVIVEKKTDPSYETHRFWLNVAIPADWGAILGDCIHNLRSALDYLAHAIVIDGGGTPTKYTAFPIGSDATHYRTSLRKSYVVGASPDALKLLDRLKPYHGGCDALDRLHRLDIADKHQLLIPVAAAHKMFRMQYHVTDEATRLMPKGPMLRASPDRKFPLKNGDILYKYPRVRLPFQDDSEFEFAFEIAFGEGQIFDGEPVVPTLTQLVDFTEGVIDIFVRRILKISW